MKIQRNQRLLIVAAVVAVGVSFYGGMLTQKAVGRSSTAMARSGSFGSSGQGGGFGGGSGGGGFRRPGAFGTVQSISGTTMTVSGRSSSTITVSLSGNPTVTKSDGSQGAVSDIATGDTVLVRGTTASNGTVTATSIMINPSFGGGGGSGGSGSGTTDSEGGSSDGATPSGI